MFPSLPSFAQRSLGQVFQACCSQAESAHRSLAAPARKPCFSLTVCPQRGDPRGLTSSLFPQPAAPGGDVLGFPRRTLVPREGWAPPCLCGCAPMRGGNSLVKIHAGCADGEVRLTGESVGWVLLGGFPRRWCTAEGGPGHTACHTPYPPTAAHRRVCLRNKNSSAVMVSPFAPTTRSLSELTFLARQVANPVATSRLKLDISQAFSVIAIPVLTHRIHAGPLGVPSIFHTLPSAFIRASPSGLCRCVGVCNRF